MTRKCTLKTCRSELPSKKDSDYWQEKGFCNIECMSLHGLEKGRKALERKRKADELGIKKRISDLRKKVKTKSEWLSELQVVFNKYIRLRDSNLGCISCDKASSWSGQWHASHYYSRGHSSFLRFNLWNVHKSCSVCNTHLSGNIGEYTPAIIKKIGQDRFDYLLSHKADIASFDIEWIERAIKITKKAIKRKEKKL